MHWSRITLLTAALVGVALLFAGGRVDLGEIEGATQTYDVRFGGLKQGDDRISWADFRQEWEAFFDEDPGWAKTFETGGNWYVGAVVVSALAFIFAIPGALTRKHMARTASSLAAIATVLAIIGLAVFGSGFGEYEDATPGTGSWGAGLVVPLLGTLLMGTTAVMGWLPIQVPSKTIPCPRCKSAVTVRGKPGTRVAVTCQQCGASGKVRA